MVAHMLHVQSCGVSHAALSMEAIGGMQPVTKFSVLTNTCVICSYHSMHASQATMIAMKNTAILDTPIPLHLCSDKTGLSVAGA